MPHVWSPLIAPLIRKAGILHVVVAHDIDSHPGDMTALVNRWLLREAAHADHIVALSKIVANRLVAAHDIPHNEGSVLFHPDLDYGAAHADADNSQPLRVLFLGRLLPTRAWRYFVRSAISP